MRDKGAVRTAAVNGRLWGARARDWAEFQEVQCRTMYESVFRDVGLAAGMAYCDLGCGAGLATQIAAERGAQVSGLDASEELLAIAQSRVPGGAFQVGDLQELPFADDSFELVTGFNAFQYAADPTAALAEARRVARKGSQVVVLTWGDPKGMEAAALVAALKPLLPAPPPGAPGPFALSDPDALKALASSAGLTPGEIRDVECRWDFEDLAAAVRGLGASGVAVRAAEHAGQDAVDAAHREALSRFEQPDGRYRVSASFRWLAATA